MSVKLLIFDWDGTLCDSLSRISHCVDLAAKEHGFHLANTLDAKEVIGLGLKESFQALFVGANKKQIALMCASYSKNFIHLDKIPSQMYEGAMDSLKYFKNQGYLLAVATGKSRNGLNRVLKEKKMTDFFDISRCSDETASKPNPLMLLEILQKLNISPEDSIMVGDTEYDLAMAVNAKVPSIAVNYGAHSPSRLKKYQPLCFIDKILEIKYHLN